MGLVTLVDNGSGSAETLPDGVTVFLGHGTQVFPLLVELLELLEGLYHILFLGQGLGLLAESGLGFEVLLEVKVTEFAVDVHEVVEFGHIELIGVVHVTETLLGHRTGVSPTVLDIAELGEGVLHLTGLFHEGLQLLDDGELGLEVLLPLGVLLFVEFGTLLLVLHVQGLETGLDGGERAHRAALQRNSGFFRRGIFVGFLYGIFFAGSGLFLGQPLIEGRFDGFGLFGPLHAVCTFFQALEQFRKFRQSLIREVHGLLFGLGGFFRFDGFSGHLDLFRLFLDFYICGLYRHHRLRFFTHGGVL